MVETRGSRTPCPNNKSTEHTHASSRCFSTTDLVYPFFQGCLRLSAPVRLIPGIACLCRPSSILFDPHPVVIETPEFWRCACLGSGKHRSSLSSHSKETTNHLAKSVGSCFLQDDLRGPPVSSACRPVSITLVETTRPHISKNNQI